MTPIENPSHPGEVLSELCLQPLGMSALALVKRLNVPRTRIERLAKGRTSLSVDTALRLSRCFGNKPKFWMNLQRAYDIARAGDARPLGSRAPGGRLRVHLLRHRTVPPPRMAGSRMPNAML